MADITSWHWTQGTRSPARASLCRPREQQVLLSCSHHLLMLLFMYVVFGLRVCLCSKRMCLVLQRSERVSDPCNWSFRWL